MSRPLHPKKEIEAALSYAEEEGWRVKIGGSHAWGRIYCPYNDNECRCGEFCIASVWSTPGNPESHARALRRVVDKMFHSPTPGRGGAEELNYGIHFYPEIPID